MLSSRIILASWFCFNSVFHRKFRFSGCVDYIWYSPNELQVDRILELPHQDILHKIGSIPNTSFGGSDHINLVAEFSFTRKSARHAPVFLRSLEGDFRALIRY